jgi:hypothetical protein
MDKPVFINQLPEFSIDVFLKDKNGVIKDFNSKILEPKKTNHRFFQSIPRSLRRRAASHNPKRVPSQFRNSQKGLKTNPKNHILNKLERKGKLPYHVWFSKRFKMIQYFGTLIPLISKEKTFTKSYYAAKHRSILFDLSYFKKIRINCCLFNQQFYFSTNNLISPVFFSALVYKKSDKKLVLYSYILRVDTEFIILFPPHFQNLYTSDLITISESLEDFYFTLLYGPKSKNLVTSNSLADIFNINNDRCFVFIGILENYIKILDALRPELNHNLRIGGLVDYEQFCFERNYHFPSNEMEHI